MRSRNSKTHFDHWKSNPSRKCLVAGLCVLAFAYLRGAEMWPSMTHDESSKYLALPVSANSTNAPNGEEI